MTLQRLIPSARLIAVLLELTEIAMLAETIQTQRITPPLIAMRLLVDRSVLRVNEMKRPCVAGCIVELGSVVAFDHGSATCDGPTRWYCCAWNALGVGGLRAEGREVGEDVG